MPKFPGDDQHENDDDDDDEPMTAGGIELGGAHGFLPVVHDRPPALCDFGCVNFHEVKALVDQMAPVDGSEADVRYATIRTCYPAPGIEFPLDQVVTECNRYTSGNTESVNSYRAAFELWLRSSAEKEAKLQRDLEDLLDVSDAPIELFYTVRVFAPDGQTIIGEVSTTSEPTPDHVRDLVPALEHYAAREISVQVRDQDGKFLSAFSFTA